MSELALDSTDLDVIEEFLSGAFARLELGRGSGNGPVRARMHRRTKGSLSLDELAFSFELTYDVAPLGQICLARLHTGTFARTSAGAEGTFGPDEVFSFADPDRPCTGRIDRCRYGLVLFDEASLSRVAATAPGRRPGPVRLTGHAPVDPSASAMLRRVLDYLPIHLGPGTLDAAGPQGERILMASAAQYLASVVLTVFPNTALADPTIEDRHDAHTGTLRRAVGFIEAHPEQPISVTDVAAAAYVTVRAVQLAFRRHLDTTPTAYLRRVRLDRAHQDLLTADPTRTTVTAVAARWGFSHASHFATAYRDLYGRSPGDTLHGRR
jgi:AraC-like DNA-binding protein